MKPRTKIAIEGAKLSIRDEGVFSYDQIQSLEDMITILAKAIEVEAVTPFIHDVSHKIK